MVLDQGHITDEGIADIRKRVGSYFQGEYIGLHNKVMTKQAIAHWCDGIGDYNNPLYRDEKYAKKTKYGTIIAPPCSLNSVNNITGMRAGGLSGVHAFHSGWDWLWLKPVKVNDTITCTYQPVDVVEKSSAFAKRTVIVYSEGVYHNQRDEVVAKCVGWSIRADRGVARETGKYSDVTAHVTTDAELKHIQDVYDQEEVRGSVPRYWDDVNEGDELTPLVKGPLGIGEMMAWEQGIGPGGEVHIFKIQNLRKHPGWGYRNPKTGARETIAQVHEQDDAAQGIAIPMAYDLGAQRNSWVSQILTNWMGDDAWLKTLHCEYRRFNVYGDTQFIKGKVSKKYVENGEHLVRCEVWAENQRAEITAPGWGTVMLPSKVNAKKR